MAISEMKAGYRDGAAQRCSSRARLGWRAGSRTARVCPGTGSFLHALQAEVPLIHALGTACPAWLGSACPAWQALAPPFALIALAGTHSAVTGSIRAGGQAEGLFCCFKPAICHGVESSTRPRMLYSSPRLRPGGSSSFTVIARMHTGRCPGQSAGWRSALALLAAGGYGSAKFPAVLGGAVAERGPASRRACLWHRWMRLLRTRRCSHHAQVSCSVIVVPYACVSCVWGGGVGSVFRACAVGTAAQVRRQSQPPGGCEKTACRGHLCCCRAAVAARPSVAEAAELSSGASSGVFSNDSTGTVVCQREWPPCVAPSPGPWAVHIDGRDRRWQGRFRWRLVRQWLLYCKYDATVTALCMRERHPRARQPQSQLWHT